MQEDAKCYNKDEIIKRLKRVEGQVRGIIRMIEEEKECVDILTQVAAAKAAINKTGTLVLKKYCRDCINTTFGDKDAAAVAKLLEIIEKSYDY